ncbi:hypothetical protein ACFFMN_23970 [Planobispora siamensis]|uniref:Uncharacterized protein n=1 Tax=Planobispora siamensis TaxID=936338 RepID=A0A8J3SMY0_9ACTN|nr:hypothetical protein [Planobispora siamensis]GIH95395.1 hypothetical protein Psi01_60250 [Planobispora siamensis]
MTESGRRALMRAWGFSIAVAIVTVLVAIIGGIGWIALAIGAGAVAVLWGGTWFALRGNTVVDPQVLDAMVTRAKELPQDVRLNSADDTVALWITCSPLTIVIKRMGRSDFEEMVRELRSGQPVSTLLHEEFTITGRRLISSRRHVTAMRLDADGRPQPVAPPRVSAWATVRALWFASTRNVELVSPQETAQLVDQVLAANPAS